MGNISVSFFWKDEKFRKACKITSAGWHWLEKSGLEEGNVTGLVSRNGDVLGQLNATREFNKTLWRTDKEETAKYS